jgi:uncharacterized membrane protein YczE
MHAVPVAVVNIFLAGTHAWVRGTRLLLGLGVFAAGLALMVRAALGLSSWDVLHDAIAGLTALSFGGAIVVVSVVVVVASATLGVSPGLGTVANMLLIGAFTDVFLSTDALENLHSAGVVPRTLALTAGVAAIAFGTALYIGADLGAGPRDSLMLALSKRLRTTPGRARTLIELSVLVAGVLFGGRAGIGTLLFAFLIGPAIDVSFTLLGMQDSASKKPGRIRAAINATASWLSRGQLRSGDDIELGRHTGARR